jgi:hypothetical protein
MTTGALKNIFKGANKNVGTWKIIKVDEGKSL